MILLEIGMTVFAWRRGWRWLALLPVVAAIAVGFLVGFIGALAGNESAIDTMPLWAWISIDVVACLSLVGMIAAGKRRPTHWNPKTGELHIGSDV